MSDLELVGRTRNDHAIADERRRCNTVPQRPRRERIARRLQIAEPPRPPSKGPPRKRAPAKSKEAANRRTIKKKPKRKKPNPRDEVEEEDEEVEQDEADEDEDEAEEEETEDEAAATDDEEEIDEEEETDEEDYATAGESTDDEMFEVDEEMDDEAIESIDQLIVVGARHADLRRVVCMILLLTEYERERDPNSKARAKRLTDDPNYGRAAGSTAPGRLECDPRPEGESMEERCAAAEELARKVLRRLEAREAGLADEATKYLVYGSADDAVVPWWLPALRSDLQILWAEFKVLVDNIILGCASACATLGAGQSGCRARLALRSQTRTTRRERTAWTWTTRKSPGPRAEEGGERACSGGEGARRRRRGGGGHAHGSGDSGPIA